jgi:hypothetical protein
MLVAMFGSQLDTLAYISVPIASSLQLAAGEYQ